jgi:preprotein translocase subunit SecG
MNKYFEGLGREFEGGEENFTSKIKTSFTKNKNIYYTILIVILVIIIAVVVFAMYKKKNNKTENLSMLTEKNLKNDYESSYVPGFDWETKDQWVEPKKSGSVNFGIKNIKK